MTSSLKNIVNIGKDTEAKLKIVGIDSFEKLSTIGCEQAFLRLKALDSGACINLLYAIAGAIEGVKSNELTKERKQELLHFFKLTKKN